MVRSAATLAADHRVHWWLLFKNTRTVLLDFPIPPENLEIWICLWKLLILICWLTFFFKVRHGPDFNTSWGHIWSFWDLLLKKVPEFINFVTFRGQKIRASFSDMRKWESYVQFLNHCCLESGWRLLLFNNRHYSACWECWVNRTHSWSLPVLCPKWDTQESGHGVWPLSAGSAHRDKHFLLLIFILENLRSRFMFL